MTLEATILTAAVAGALGSAHCSVMCGPLALAGCSSSGRTSWRGALSYLGGRAVAYTTMGAALGHLGRHALCVLPMSTLERVAVAFVAFGAAARGVALLRGERSGGGLTTLQRRPSRRGVVAVLAEVWPRRGLGLGIATAVMPCGLLLPAWALAAGTASALEGAAVMAAFSLATLPGLVLPLAGSGLLRRVVAKAPRRAFGVAWCVLAAFTALRPLVVAEHCQGNAQAGARAE